MAPDFAGRGEPVVLARGAGLTVPPVRRDEPGALQPQEDGIERAALDLTEPRPVECLGELVPIRLAAGQQGEHADVEHAAQPLPPPVLIHAGEGSTAI